MALIALVRPPSAAMQEGERTYIDRAPIDFARAERQHAEYADVLRAAGAQVVMVPRAETLPDSVFIEDAALVLDAVAVIARSGAMSRRAETPPVADALSRYRPLVHLPEGAHFDGGDALVIGRKVYVGHSGRTNQVALDFLDTLLRQYFYELIPVRVTGCLHMKSAVTYIGDNTVLMNPQWVTQDVFREYTRILVDESMGANALLVGQQLLMSASYPATLRQVETRGFRPRALEMSEFHKAEAALTCLSILLEAG